MNASAAAGDPVRWLDAQLAVAPDRILLETRAGSRLSYRQMYELSGWLAAALAKRSIAAGHRVAVQLDRSGAAVALYLACLRIGAIFVPLNTAYTPAELEYFLADAEPGMFVVRPQDESAAASIVRSTGIDCIETLGVAGDGTLMELAHGQSSM